MSHRERGKIRVSRKGHHRKGYTRKDGAHVKPAYISSTTFKIEDRGKIGRTPKKKRWFKPKRKMVYKGKAWCADCPASVRRQVLAGLVKTRGYATVVGELNALRNVSTVRKVDKVCKADMAWLKRKYR